MWLWPTFNFFPVQSSRRLLWPLPLALPSWASLVSLSSWSTSPSTTLLCKCSNSIQVCCQVLILFPIFSSGAWGCVVPIRPSSTLENHGKYTYSLTMFFLQPLSSFIWLTLLQEFKPKLLPLYEHWKPWSREDTEVNGLWKMEDTRHVLAVTRSHSVQFCVWLASLSWTRTKSYSEDLRGTPFLLHQFFRWTLTNE